MLDSLAKIFGVALVAGIMASPLLAKEYYVSQNAANASDDNPGTEAAPWKTINRSLKSVVAGDTVHIGGGVYREQVVLTGEDWTYAGERHPKAPAGTDFGNMISFVGERGQQVIIKGSDVVADWTPYKDAIWVRNDWPHNSEQVFCDGKPLTQIAGKMVKYLDEIVTKQEKWRGRKGSSLADIEAGSFYVDLDAKKLYVWLPDGSDPSKHVIEAGVRTFGVCLYNTQYIKLANLSIQHVNTSAKGNLGGLNVFGTGHTIDHVDSSWNDVTGLHMKGRNHTVSNSTFDYNGNCGITGEGRGVRIINCQTNYNNRRQWWTEWHAGGIKLIPYAEDFLISGHTAAYNHGQGIWFDSWNTQVTIENSRIHNNEGMGIFYEISQRAVIRNNVLHDNGGRGIYVSNSANCLVAHNLCYGNGMSGILIGASPRKAPPLFGHPDTGTIYCDNNYVYGNILMDNCNPVRTPRDKDGEGRSWSLRPELILPDPGMVNARNNVSDYNVFYRSDGRPMPFWAGWGSGKEVVQAPDFAAWRKATANDAHSVVAQPLFVSLEKRDFHPLANSPVFFVPPLPTVRDDAEGRFFATKKKVSKSTWAAHEVGLTDSVGAAGPYAGE